MKVDTSTKTQTCEKCLSKDKDAVCEPNQMPDNPQRMCASKKDIFIWILSYARGTRPEEEPLWETRIHELCRSWKDSLGSVVLYGAMNSMTHGVQTQW